MIGNWVLSTLILCLVSRGRSEISGKTEPVDLWRIFDEALPADVFAALEGDVMRVHRYTENEEVLKFGKRSTFWFSNDKPARSSIEVAIRLLEEYMGSGKGDSSMTEGLVRRKASIGAEWWIQVVPADGGNIGFHYDKDEGMASTQMKMVHPLLSTVTYITSHGSPTVVLNQTCPFGNENSPVIATSGLFSYPARNRHLVFRGDLNHGVVGSLDVPHLPPAQHETETGTDGEAVDIDPPAGDYRITLLINWWDRQPMVPNTMVLTNPRSKKMGIETWWHSSVGCAARVQACNGGLNKCGIKNTAFDARRGMAPRCMSCNSE